MLDLPALGANSDGTVAHPTPAFAAGALRVGQKPLQPPSKLLEIETVRTGKTVAPDVGPNLVQVALEPDHRFQQIGIAQLAIFTQTAITLSHGLSPAMAVSLLLPCNY